MKILISGCSFTHWPEFPGGPNVCWPKYLQKIMPDVEFKSEAEPAAGNQYICNSVIHSVLDQKPDYVLVMWSGVSRLDFLTNIEDPNWLALFDSYGFYRRVFPGDKLGYIFSGGQMGTWFKHPVAHKMFYEMYKVSNPRSLGYTNLIEIIKLQEFLKSQRIPYKFMSYVNYWNNKEYVSRNGDFGVLAYPELAKLTEGIDFEPWIFLNDQRDGIYELAIEKQNFMEDGFHPGDQVNEQWAQIIRDQLPL